MADEPENLALRMLRQVDAKLDIVMERLHDLTARVGSVEDQLVILRSDVSGLPPISFVLNIAWTALINVCNE
jgi:hypothetical protein